MITALGALCYTLVVALIGPRLVTGRAWSSRWPRLGLLVCQAVALAIVSGLVLMTAMLVVSVQHLRFDLGHLIHACALALSDAARHPDGLSPLWLGLVALALLGHIGRTAFNVSTAGRLSRRRHRDGLALVASVTPNRDYMLVPSAEPFAYCLPGRGGQIVVSTATTSLLSVGELEAVLAHERAHLRGRHHHLITLTEVLAKALFIPRLRSLAEEVEHLVELAADDRACRNSERDDLLSALMRLSASPPSEPALAVTGGSTWARACRLAEPRPVRHSLVGAATGLLAVVLVVLPWSVVAATAVLATAGRCTA